MKTQYILIIKTGNLLIGLWKMYERPHFLHEILPRTETKKRKRDNKCNSFGLATQRILKFNEPQWDKNELDVFESHSMCRNKCVLYVI